MFLQEGLQGILHFATITPIMLHGYISSISTMIYNKLHHGCRDFNHENMQLAWVSMISENSIFS